MKIPVIARFAVSLGAVLILSAQGYSQIPVWVKNFDGQGLCVGLNPLNPNTIYTQGNDNRLYVSRNKGQSWTALPTFLPFELREILVHPKDTLTIFVTDEGNGLRKSTDGGNTWTNVLPGYSIDGESFTYDPAHPDTMYAGNFPDAAIYRSSDRGSTWTLQGHAGFDLCALGVRPDSANILYAGTGNGTIAKSTDQGVHWHQVKSGGSQEIPRIVFNPSNPQIAYGTAFLGNQSSDGVWKTTDGGEHWFLVGLQFISMWGIDIDQNHPDTLYAGTFSEYSSTVYRSSDGGSTWITMDNGLLPFNSIWNLKVDQTNPSNVYIGITSGDFGPNGVYKLTNANAGIRGYVRDSLNFNPITTGTLTVQPPGVSSSLAPTFGFYSFFRFDPDTVTNRTFNVFLSGELFKQQQIPLVPGVRLDQDLLVALGSIRGKIFNDLNGNGVQDGGESGLSGWSVLLDGQLQASTVSDGSGNYSFDDLYPGSYSVSERTLYGWAQTSPNTASYSLVVDNVNKVLTGKDFGNSFSKHVLGVSPLPSSNNVVPLPLIRAAFDTAMNVSLFNDTLSWIVRGSHSGRHRGSFAFNAGGDSVAFTPATPFKAGEVVTVDITSVLHAANGHSFTPFSFQFTIGVSPSGGGILPKVDYVVGTAPWGVAAADLDNDGDVDIVAACATSGAVSVLKNNGNGTFAAKVDYSVASTPRGVALGDLDNDGDIDIVAASNGFSVVTVLLNNGDGTFAPGTDINVGGVSSTVSLADMDGDGSLDIVATNANNSAVAILKNNGHASFAVPAVYSAGSTPWAVFTADLNNDGGMDVLAGNSISTSTISYLPNSGNGIVALQSTYGVGAFTRSVIVADIDNDNRPDLLATNTNGNTVVLYPQTSIGVFGPRADFPTANAPWTMASGDMNGDGFIDLCVVDVSSNAVSFLKSAGGTNFTRQEFTTGTGPRALALADLDNDGDLDIIVGNSSTNTVSILLNAATAPVANGWNMVSLPVKPGNFAKTSLYPTAVSNAFKYAGGYQTTDSLKNGAGYWLKFGSNQTLNFNGSSVLLDTVPVTSSWNIIGALSVPVATNTITSNPPGIIGSSYFGYNSGYGVAKTLAPGSGYWIKTTQPGSIILNSAAAEAAPQAKEQAIEAFHILAVQDKAGRRQTLYVSTNPGSTEILSRYELPPVPPAGIFDVRFASGRMLEVAGTMKEFPVTISAADYPLTISWDVDAPELAVKSSRLNASLKIGNDEIALPSGGSATVSNPGSPIVLKLSGSAEIPKEFSLGQNFPNPFNPVTSFKFSIASRELTVLKVYDVLGQEVSTLVNEVKEPGVYTISWDAGKLSSGVYVYSITAGSFSERKKMMLIR